MSTSPQYVGTPKNGTAQVTAANTNRDGTGTVVTVYTAGASGSRIDSLLIKAAATTTAGMVRLYISDGAAKRLIKEVPVVAVTPSASTPTWEAEVLWPAGLVLQATWSLHASTHNAETFNLIPLVAGDF